ncbi:MAG TPA: HNH endonuclease signature motif containing protein, partial [Actinomycetes bacterium]
RHITATHATCGFPGCNRPAQACDCDHILEHTRGGKTILTNLGPLCRTHHNAKTHGLWTYTYDPDRGTKTWTSPLGLTHTKHLPRYGPTADHPPPEPDPPDPDRPDGTDSPDNPDRTDSPDPPDVPDVPDG